MQPRIELGIIIRRHARIFAVNAQVTAIEAANGLDFVEIGGPRATAECRWRTWPELIWAPQQEGSQLRGPRGHWVLARWQLPERWAERPPLSWLLVFGRAPLFFYALHMCVYAFMGLPFALEMTGLGGVYVEWIVGLLVCYYPTKLFGRFKQSTSKDSLWRLF